MLKDIGHPYARGRKVYDIAFENVQAGERTSHLFRLAKTPDGDQRQAATPGREESMTSVRRVTLRTATSTEQSLVYAVPAGVMFGEYVPYLLFLAFGDGTLTGMALTLAVVYRPQWVATFDDAFYIAGR